MIRLHMNEMPFLPPEAIRRKAEKGLEELNRYSDPGELGLLKKALSEYSGIDESHIILSPGSDILLRELILSFSQDRKIVMLSPSFLPTVQTARQYARNIVRIKLSPPKFSLNPNLLTDELHEPSLFVLENPNNPTGKLVLDHETAGTILSDPNALCIIDEAYFEFSRYTCAALLREFPNLAVTRSMDKSFSLAGARVGYLLAGDFFLEAFSSFYAFLPRSSLNAALAALQNTGYMDDHISFIVSERDRLRNLLIRKGLSVCKSEANFLMIATGLPDAARQLKERDILVADMTHQLAPGYIRASIGTREQNDYFAEVLGRLV